MYRTPVQGPVGLPRPGGGFIFRVSFSFQSFCFQKFRLFLFRVSKFVFRLFFTPPVRPEWGEANSQKHSPPSSPTPTPRQGELFEKPFLPHAPREAGSGGRLIRKSIHLPPNPTPFFVQGCKKFATRTVFRAGPDVLLNSSRPPPPLLNGGGGGVRRPEIITFLKTSSCSHLFA